MSRPNLVYIHSHDTGRYVSPYGFAVPTPNIERFARQGLLFRNAYSAAPTCSPSRAALLTGQAPHDAGMLGLAHRGFTLNDPRQLLPSYLADNGYETALAGMQHVAGSARDLPYTSVLTTGGREYVREVVPRVETWLAERAGSGRDQPFFLDAGFFETHRPYPGPEDDPSYLGVPVPMPDVPPIREDMAGYHASVRELDRGVGAIVAAIGAAGLADSTIVILTTDHGLPFPRMKCNLTAHGIGVMLMMRGPSPIPSGAVTDALVSQIDLYPTICDLIGLGNPDWLQGHSLMPMLEDATTEVDDEVYAEVTFHAAYDPQRAVRTRRWSYIRRFGDRRTPTMPNVDDSPARDVFVAAGWPSRQLPDELLFDLAVDPTESMNVAGDPGFAAELDDMRGRLERWMRRTNDPLLRGPVIPGPGVVVNDPDGDSPEGGLFTVSPDGKLRPLDAGEQRRRSGIQSEG